MRKNETWTLERFDPESAHFGFETPQAGQATNNRDNETCILQPGIAASKARGPFRTLPSLKRGWHLAGVAGFGGWDRLVKTTGLACDLDVREIPARHAPRRQQDANATSASSPTNGKPTLKSKHKSASIEPNKPL